MPKYGLATIFETHPVGHEFVEAILPVHLTHVDSFEINLDAIDLADKLRKYLSGMGSFSVMATQDVMYGPDRDIPVTELELTPQLALLHNRIVDLLNEEGATLKRPEFTKERYKPHISIYGDRRIQPGDSIVIRDISIAAKVGDEDNASRVVLANILLH